MRHGFECNAVLDIAELSRWYQMGQLPLQQVIDESTLGTAQNHTLAKQATVAVHKAVSETNSLQQQQGCMTGRQHQ